MSLLLDENLSRRLQAMLTAKFPGSLQPRLAGLATAPPARSPCFSKREQWTAVLLGFLFQAFQSACGAPEFAAEIAYWFQQGHVNDSRSRIGAR